MPLDAADGSWPRLLMELGGLSPEQLTDTHQPCPNCGGEDRYRWDCDDGPGGWFCNQCGGKDRMGGGGNGMDLLMRVKGWEFKDACRRVEEHLGIASTRPRPPAPTAGAERFWPYNDDFIVCRFPDPVKGKKVRPLLWTGSKWEWKSPPKPRPLYWARRRADAPVMIAEGEPAIDAAAQLFPDHACVTWPGGTPSVDKADWSALRGRTVTIWPDADDVGRKAASQLARILLGLQCTVQAVEPPDALPQGWDLADALAEGWTPAKAAKAVERCAKQIQGLPEPEPEPAPSPPAPEPEPPADIPTSRPFTCLGFDEGIFYYQPRSTGQVTGISRGSHTGTNLVQLAELSYWETLYPSKTGVNWLAAASSLFAEQARVGIFSPDRIRGRGAWWDAGRSVLHLGDRLLIDGELHPIAKPPRSKFHYQRLASIDLPDGIEPLTDHLGAELIDIASRFHWEVPASGLLLAGWIALAPICGALQWRPHLWLTASAGSGKSAILDRLVGPLIESLALFPEGNTTEAYIRQQLRSDAVPVVFDEAESNEKADRQRIQNILSLARVASSAGRGVIGKGGADGTAQSFTIRSMFLLCSISTALKQGADQSRFAQLTLRNPSYLPKEQRIAHWSALDAEITRLCTPETGHRLMLRMVQQIPIIRDSVAVFRRAAAERFDSQRQGDQYGTLLAGAWSLMSSRAATIEDAYQLIDANDWEAYKEQSEADEERCLQHILQYPMRIELERMEVIGGKVFNRVSATTRTVWELVEAMNGSADTQEILPEAAEPHLGRLGIRVSGGRLMIANTALGLQRILADTPWAHSWPTVLARLPGAEKAGKVRFKGMSNSSRAVSLPLPKD
jgi:putative DNA primase/helicase